MWGFFFAWVAAVGVAQAAADSDCQVCTKKGSYFSVKHGTDGVTGACVFMCVPQTTWLRSINQCIKDTKGCEDLPEEMQSIGNVPYPADSCYALQDCNSCNAKAGCQYLSDWFGATRCLPKGLVSSIYVSEPKCPPTTTTTTEAAPSTVATTTPESTSTTSEAAPTTVATTTPESTSTTSEAAPTTVATTTPDSTYTSGAQPTPGVETTTAGQATTKEGKLETTAFTVPEPMTTADPEPITTVKPIEPTHNPTQAPPNPGRRPVMLLAGAVF